MEEFQGLFLSPDIMLGKKALCVQPHPDDNEVGMGGIVAVLTNAGCQVDYLTVTDGALGALSPALTGAALAGVRKQEVEAAGTVLGVTAYHYLALPDGSLNDIPALAGQIAELIRSGQYDMVFCPDPWLSYEAHWDHVVTGRAVAQAFISCSLIEYPRGTATPPCAPFAIGFYFTNKPNTVINITETFDTKFAAMAAHQSQMPEQLLDLYRTYFTMRGMSLAEGKDFTLGEGLRVMSPLHMHCFAEGESI
ncbi:MAG: PIG-L deacetylase family protein [Lachnospiraceae bacterium]